MSGSNDFALFMKLKWIQITNKCENPWTGDVRYYNHLVGENGYNRSGKLEIRPVRSMVMGDDDGNSPIIGLLLVII